MHKPIRRNQLAIRSRPRAFAGLVRLYCHARGHRPDHETVKRKGSVLSAGCARCGSKIVRSHKRSWIKSKVSDQPRAICFINRHVPDRDRIKWDGEHYIGNCHGCNRSIRRLESGKWLVDWLVMARR